MAKYAGNRRHPQPRDTGDECGIVLQSWMAINVIVDIILQLSNLGIKPFDVLSDVVGNVL
ncbi:hypothetical protein HMPREF9710_04032 [Massilia timonae CCUG 45783]|uniref:Uncharacterized protein n=1 Tax=Massilia timonae CCUG 45783 TaxID=883126 RepID=K9D8C7_9BURK|nr:hypothetical protein HMPREF9710_04032 [Massilia timonae CCUG 45783]